MKKYQILATVLMLFNIILPISVDASVEGKPIIVVTREAGSGTRGAFVELAEIVNHQGDDNITVEADVLNTTGGIVQMVAGNPSAIGYISYGTLNSTVKPLTLNGVAVTPETVISGDYPLARPFNLAWHAESLTPLASEFLTFIFSKEGQAIVEKSGYMSVGSLVTWQGQQAGSYMYQAQTVSGDLTVVGSTSVTPVMEKLAEEFERIHHLKIDITSNGSTAGMMAALNGTADIGMASRELKVDEREQLESYPLALDGILMVVNPQNSLTNITSEQLRNIYSGVQTNW